MPEWPANSGSESLRPISEELSFPGSMEQERMAGPNALFFTRSSTDMLLAMYKWSPRRRLRLRGRSPSSMRNRRAEESKILLRKV